jgi:HEPN domain-containing protein
MNRAEARHFAEARVVDAKILLDASRWHAAYYLIGYAVECGLKACVLSYVESTGIIFQDKRFAEKCFTHDIEMLAKVANLEIARGLDMAANPALGVNWRLVMNWNVDARYQDKSEAEARRLYEAVTHNANGVLAWIRARW